MTGDEYAELSASLVHEVSTPMAVAKVNLEIIARYLPLLLTIYRHQEPTLTETDRISTEHLDALCNAPALMEAQCRIVEQSVKNHWRSAKEGSDAATDQNELAPNDASPAARRRSLLSPTRLNILLVEDEQVHQDIALKVLSPDHQVDVTASAREALSHCQTRPYDLVLLDLRLPDLDGRQLAKLLRRTHAPGLCIAALSNYPVTVDELRQAGFDGQLEKPLKAEAFRQFLQQVSLALQQES
jgi:CheY-like chemotaxis protein